MDSRANLGGACTYYLLEARSAGLVEVLREVDTRNLVVLQIRVSDGVLSFLPFFKKGRELHKKQNPLTLKGTRTTLCFGTSLTGQGFAIAESTVRVLGNIPCVIRAAFFPPPFPGLGTVLSPQVPARVGAMEDVQVGEGEGIVAPHFGMVGIMVHRVVELRIHEEKEEGGGGVYHYQQATLTE